MLSTSGRFAFTLFALLVFSYFYLARLPQPVKAVAYTRNVFLQKANTSSFDFRWVTDTQEQLKVKYGLTTAYGGEVTSDTEQLVNCGNNAGFPCTGGSNNHAKITGLAPNTKYYYQVITVSGTPLTVAGDQNHYFETPPAVGSATPFSFAVFGDSGNNSTAQNNVAKQVFAKKPDLVMIAGDIAYGYTTDFNNNNNLYFNRYSDAAIGQNSMAFSPFYVTCGNHETSCPTVMADHSLPGGGKMTSQLSTYSYDYGNVHFVALNSNGSYAYNATNPSASDPQVAWAYNDLRASNQPWKVVYWHHNGWSAGSHSSNTAITDNLVRMASDAGADIVLWGHSHVYERWNRVSGFYPNLQIYTIGNGGKYGASSCTATSPGPGCAAKSSLGDSEAGFLLFEVNGDTMTARYITQSGANPDTITLTSVPGTTPSPLPTPTPLSSPSLIPSPIPTPTPLSSGIIANLVVNDTVNGIDWSIQPNLQVGNQQYGDRTFTFTQVPSQVAGNTWVRTAADSKTYTASPLTTFQVINNATVYVAHDDRITTKPSWLTSWTDTGLDLVNSESTPTIFSLFSQPFTANQTVSLGPNGSNTTNTYLSYSVIVAPTGSTSPTPSASNSGDANGDGKVDGVDYQIWLSHYAETTSGGVSVGDFNGDTKVNGIDFVIWRMTYTPLLASPLASPSPVSSPPAGGQVKAFYGAEGFGANSVGGRGGKVIEVTNLNDSGTGSLRDCISQSGSRTCVFRVAGTITVNSQMNINNPFITIAGQTAPGGGITIRTATTDNNDEGPIVLKTHDVVIRYIRVRLGPGGTTSSCCLSGIRMLGNNSNPENFYNIIIDHVSNSWSIDENISSWYAQSKISVQWSIASEGLYASTHSGGELHSKAIFIGDHAKEVSVHHNLMAHNHDRNPMMKPDTTTEIINNVIYNWDKSSNGSTNFGGSADNSALTLIQANAINNNYLQGPDTPTGSNDKGISIGIFDAIDASSKLYVRGNIGPGRTSNNEINDCSINDTNWNAVNGNASYRNCNSIISSGSVTEHAVETLKTTLINGVGDIPGVGASVGLDANGSYISRRDAVDKRIIEEVNRGEGTLIDCPWYNVPSQSFCAGLIPGTQTPRRFLTNQSYTKYGINDPLDVDGWPILDPGTPFADSDHDGMADTWEINNFGSLSRGSATDSSSDFDADGYTDLEEFLNTTDPKV